MSLRSRISWFFRGAEDPIVPPAPTAQHPSRHDRREAGRKRHHAKGGSAWDASDRIDETKVPDKNPDAAPEILGGG